jgi:hypothetical protein
MATTTPVTVLAGIYDDAGRYLAPLPVELPVRPAGPWDANVAAPVVVPVPVICAWCPGFNKADPAHRNASHGICPRCSAKVLAERTSARMVQQVAA